MDIDPIGMHMKQNDSLMQEHYTWFLHDLDIKGFFDTIDQDLLMKAVKHYCSDRWVLMNVQRWLQAGVVNKEGM